MDFKTYITAVETQLSQMTETQKTDWIFAQARTVEENQREEFLDALSGKKKLCTELKPDEIFAWCNQVEEGEIYLKTEEYEYYEEGAWESDWRVEYHDVFGIVPFLKKALNTCYQLLWQKEYHSTFQLLDRICRLEFHTDEEDDFYYDEGLTVETLADEGLFSIDFKKLSLCLLYACYQISTGQERIEKLYDYLKWKQCSEIVMTDVFAYGPEKIEDETAFMENWRSFLMDTPSDRAAELLVDACIYLGGDDYLLKTAEENVSNHPYLYLAYCEKKYQSQDYVSCIAAAKKAVEQIDANKVIRADISDIAIKSVKKNGSGNIGYFYWKSFYSNPNSWHLLRLFKLEDKTVIAKALKRVNTLEAAPFLGSRDSLEKKEVALSDKEQKMLYCFLLGDYSDILKKCQKKSYVSGMEF